MSKEAFEEWAGGNLMYGGDKWAASQGWQAGIKYVTSRPTTNTRLDKAEFKTDNPETIVDRLRGIYPVPGVPGVYRSSPVQHEAARRIEYLENLIKRMAHQGSFDAELDPEIEEVIND